MCQSLLHALTEKLEAIKRSVALYKVQPVILLVLVALIFTGCSQSIPTSKPTAGFATGTPPVATTAAVTAVTTAAPTPLPTATPAPPAPQVLSIEAVADPSVETDLNDPSLSINKYTLDIYKPDKALYRAVYLAANQMIPKLDISAYKLTVKQKAASCDSLYGAATFELFYIKYIRLSNNNKTVKFTYTGTKEQNSHNQETYYANLSHLLHNVVPEDGTELQKFFSVYQYLCETSNYTANIQDQSTCSPYSILVNHSGICWGYASLTAYVLNKLGIPAEYVCNEPHAWNIVKLGGKWYHSDVTWGAGNAGSVFNYVNTVLMDDKTRLDSLKESGYSTEGIIVGYPAGKQAVPHACTDTTFAKYNSIPLNDALDIDHGKVYYGENNCIMSMNLDCTGQTKVSDKDSGMMAYFDGNLYFVGRDDGYLYKMKPGEPAVVLDKSQFFFDVWVENGTLFYGVSPEKAECKKISLLKADKASAKAADTVRLPEATVPRSRSFSLQVRFSAPMDKAADLNSLVLLQDSKGNPLPLRFSWSADGQTLTVRPRDCVADLGSVVLLVKKGMSSSAGTATQKVYSMETGIVSGK